MPDSPSTLVLFLQSAWAQIVALVGVIVWLVRGEAATKANKAEIDRLWAARKEDLASAQKSRDDTAAMLKEMRGDIKTLLARK